MRVVDRGRWVRRKRQAAGVVFLGFALWAMHLDATTGPVDWWVPVGFVAMLAVLLVGDL